MVEGHGEAEALQPQASAAFGGLEGPTRLPMVAEYGRPSHMHAL